MDLPLDGHRIPIADRSGSDKRNRISENYYSARKIAGERLYEERDLYATKWFDYRFMSPLAATQMFESEYQKIFRLKWAQVFDREQAEKKRGLRDGGTSVGGRELTSIWRARQIADALGLPYGFFIATAMDAASGRGMRRLPRPNQLYHEWNCQRAIRAWSEWIDVTFRPSDLPQYRNEAFCGLDAQIEHRKWVVKRIKARASRHYLIGDCCFIRRILPMDLAIAEFGHESVERARREVEADEPLPIAELGHTGLWPACMGLPRAQASNSGLCATCPQQHACHVIGERLAGMLVEKHGSEDPVAAMRRAQTAARVRKHREKKRMRSAAGELAVCPPGHKALDLNLP